MANLSLLRISGLVAFLVLGGCKQPTGDEETEEPGREIAAAELCSELATLVCESDKKCCTTEVTAPKADAGAGDAGSDASDAKSDAPAPPPETCETEQLRLCRATLGPLLEDPRLGYRPERGGRLIDDLRARADQCWTRPILYADVANLFAGTGPKSADCTPPSMASRELRAASLSCNSDASCRLYLRSDGTNEGVCEARTEDNLDSCSHAFDCGPTRWCKLPKDWRPGLWGRCQPLRASGWQCASDLECESGYCGDGTCTVRNESNICLEVGYRKLVLSDAPVAYLRLSNATGRIASDSSSGGHAGEIVGELKSVDGVLANDGDKGIEIGESDTFVKVEIGKALAAGTELSLETWVSAGEAGPIFELRGSVRTSLRVYRAGEKGDELRASFLNPSDGKLRETAASQIDSGWHHVAVTHDGTTGRLFLDGKEVGSVASPYAVDASDVLYIGHRPAIEPEPAQTLRGKYDEIAVFSKAAKPGTLSRRRKAALEGIVTNTFPVFSFLE